MKNQENKFNIEQAKKDPKLCFAALKLIEQLYNDGYIERYMFRNILNEYAGVVDVSKFSLERRNDESMQEDLKGIGLWGIHHYNHLKRNQPSTICVMKTKGTLHEYLTDIDRQAEEMFPQLVKQLAERDGITEALKVTNQMEWVRRMNTVREQATEIVNKELIFV